MSDSDDLNQLLDDVELDEEEEAELEALGGDGLLVLNEKDESNDDHLSSDARTFGNAFISFIGAGILGLPFAFKLAGVVTGTIGLSIVAAVSAYCMFIIVDCKYYLQDTLQKNVKTYGDIGYYAFGRAGSNVVDACLVITQTGFCIAYLIFISDNVHNVMSKSGALDWGPAAYIVMCMPGLALLSLLRHLKYLAPFSIIADIANITGLSVVYSYDFKQFGTDEGDMTPRKMIDTASLPLFFGLIIYCYEGIGMVIPVEGSMRNKKSFKKIWGLNLGVVTFLFWSFGVLGYAAFGDETEGIVTINLPDNFVTDSVKIILSIGLFFTYPVMLYPVFQILEDVIFRGQSGTTSFLETRRNIFRVLWCLLTAFIALSVPSFETFIALVGNSCCALLAFILPSIFHLKLMGAEIGPVGRAKDWFAIVFGLSGGVIGTVQTVSKIMMLMAEVEHFEDGTDHGAHDGQNAIGLEGLTSFSMDSSGWL